MSETDYNIREYILSLLDGRELTTKQIIQSVQRDYKRKEFAPSKINDILRRFAENYTVSRTKRGPTKDDRSHRSFTITNRGRKRLDYYRRELKKRGTYGYD